MKEVGIVVPTLGTRGEYLAACLQSLKESNVGYVCIVCPTNVDISKFIEDGLVNQKVDDPGRGLAAAINAGVNSSRLRFLCLSLTTPRLWFMGHARTLIRTTKWFGRTDLVASLRKS